MTALLRPINLLRAGLLLLAGALFLAGMTIERWYPQQRQAGYRAVPLSLLDTLPPADTLAQKVYTVAGTGDMMLGTNYPSAAYLPPRDGEDLLAEVRDILRTADVTFGNLEGTLFDSGGMPKTCKDSTICYVFRTPARYARHFVDAGYDLLSIANNHSGDFGAEGRIRTKATLDKAGIAYAGLVGTDESVVIERKGIRWGFCAFSPNDGTCDLRNLPRAQAIVRALAEKSDIIIVSFHGGAEGAAHQRVTRQKEEFHGENRGNVYAFAHAVVDAGADIVFGHGPHVTRAVELYNNRFIAYSLGNFCTYGRFSLAGPAGIAPIITLSVDEEGRFLEGLITPTYQQKHHGPRIDPQRRVIQTLINLTKADFPETPLYISPDGAITKK